MNFNSLNTQERFTVFYSFARSMYKENNSNSTVNPIGLTMYIARNSAIELNMSDLDMLKNICIIAFENQYYSFKCYDTQEEKYIALKRSLLKKWRPERFKRIRRVLRRNRNSSKICSHILKLSYKGE